MIFTQEFVEMIVHGTNIYAEQCIVWKGRAIPLRSRIRDWKPVTVEEIYVVLELLMLMGIVQKPTLSIYISLKSSKFGIKLRSYVNIAQAIYGLLEHGSGVEKKVPVCHSTDKTVTCLIKRHFTERSPPPERKVKPTTRYVMCYKQGKIWETILWCPYCDSGLCVEDCFKT
jgi:hypothetical protein